MIFFSRAIVLLLVIFYNDDKDSFLKLLDFCAVAIIERMGVQNY